MLDNYNYVVGGLVVATLYTGLLTCIIGGVLCGIYRLFIVHCGDRSKKKLFKE